jgi:aerobic-type carbon monoxide dehydrogenase small subunit (CoxS/CutS family)
MLQLLKALREHLNLVGTEFECGMARCGACTIHLDPCPDAFARRSDYVCCGLVGKEY